MDWQPECAIELLQLRAQVLRTIRNFFAERSVMEVETPLLCAATGTDPNLAFFSTEFQHQPFKQALYLQTSPEFAMKRLLSAGSGSIFQICKAFRNGETGRYHNPEFTLLEWYRVGFDLWQLMEEVSALMSLLFAHRFSSAVPVEKISYRKLFLERTGLDPLVFVEKTYREFAETIGLPEAANVCADNKSIWLDLLFSHYIQPSLGQGCVTLVYGYPSCFSSLARTDPDEPGIAQRMEVFVEGIELGNGYHELSDAKEQERRFDAEIALRKSQGLEHVEKDKRFLSALAAGMPECSGIAIGLDRLLMVLADRRQINDVLAFSVARA